VQKLQKRIGQEVSPRRLVSETLAQLAAAYDGQAGAPASDTGTEAATSAPKNGGGLMSRLRRLVQGA